MRDHILAYLRVVAIMAAMAVLVAGWFFVKRLPALVRSMIAGTWPTVEGRIETADVNVFRGLAFAEVGYSYVVQGERYSGYLLQQFGDEQLAWDYTNNLRGQSVTVRYKLAHPDVSAIRAGDQQSYVQVSGGGVLISLWSSILRDVPHQF